MIVFVLTICNFGKSRNQHVIPLPFVAVALLRGWVGVSHMPQGGGLPTGLRLREGGLLEKYVLEGTLGQGNYGKAVLATRKEDSERVVIKQIQLSDVDERAREVGVRCTLTHENPDHDTCTFLCRKRSRRLAPFPILTMSTLCITMRVFWRCAIDTGPLVAG